MTLAALVAGSFVSACLPERLQKYQRSGGHLASSASSPRDNSLLQPGTSGEDAMSPLSSVSGKREGASSARTAPNQQTRATIYAVDKRTFRFAVAEKDVWDAALSVLMRNYNLTIVDKTSGVVTTEWDSYYLDNAVFRNKVSFRLSRSGWNTVDLMIHNNVEKLRDASQAAGTVGAVWLPTADAAGEVARLVQNMALFLNQPPPILPPGTAVARDTTGQESKITR